MEVAALLPPEPFDAIHQLGEIVATVNSQPDCRPRLLGPQGVGGKGDALERITQRAAGRPVLQE